MTAHRGNGDSTPCRQQVSRVSFAAGEGFPRKYRNTGRCCMPLFRFDVVGSISSIWNQAAQLKPSNRSISRPRSVAEAADLGLPASGSENKELANEQPNLPVAVKIELSWFKIAKVRFPETYLQAGYPAGNGSANSDSSPSQQSRVTPVGELAYEFLYFAQKSHQRFERHRLGFRSFT